MILKLKGDKDQSVEVQRALDAWITSSHALKTACEAKGCGAIVPPLTQTTPMATVGSKK